ncbi:hypothetical protein Rs2_01747 [Raphanus sativus]|nr:hypothetical protein Rs2_01747 [Raphanus sativus]
MEEENDESTKRHDNTFSLHSIFVIVQVSAALAVAGYFGLEGFILWFDWFRLVLRNIFFIFIILNALIGSIYFTFRKATEIKKPSLYDEYITAVPSVVRSSPEQSTFAPMEVGDYGGGGGYYNNSSYYQESVQPFQAVEEKRVMMQTTGGSCRSWQAMMDELSNEQFRTTIESFIMEKKKMMMYGWRQNGDPQLQNGVVDDQLQNGVPQLQNGGFHQWRNGFPQLQNGGFHQWQNGFPQLQNGGVQQWQNGFPQLEGQPDYDGTGGHGPYLAISN